MAQERQALRTKIEQTEEIQYQSNCGLEIDMGNLQSHFDNELLGDNIQNTSLSVDDRKLVFFDFETSGFGKSADILQVAAKCEEHVFCKYVKPTQSITSEATAITGLENVAGELFLRGKRVQSFPLQEVLHAFKEWLAVLSKPCFLVAHNGQRFDIPHLLRALQNNSMIEDFKNLIDGFIDTLPIFKKLYPQRRDRGFKLSSLAQDLLQIELSENFHNATYDVEILEKIASTIPKEILVQSSKSFMTSLDHEILLQKKAELKQFLIGVISDEMIKKIAKAGINIVELQNIYKENGREGVDQLLSARQEDNKPRVTKNKKVIEKIVIFLDMNQTSAII